MACTLTEASLSNNRSVIFILNTDQTSSPSSSMAFKQATNSWDNRILTILSLASRCSKQKSMKFSINRVAGSSACSAKYTMNPATNLIILVPTSSVFFKPKMTMTQCTKERKNCSSMDE